MVSLVLTRGGAWLVGVRLGAAVLRRNVRLHALSYSKASGTDIQLGSAWEEN